LRKELGIYISVKIIRALKSLIKLPGMKPHYPSQYVVYKTHDIVVDGNLDKDEWQDVPFSAPFEDIEVWLNFLPSI
jgi:hypothetical protein